MRKKDIPLKRAYEILTLCSGVLLEDRFIVPSLFEIEGIPDNVWMSTHWFENHDGEEAIVFVTFNEEDNKKVVLEGCNLTLVNTDGEEEVFTLLQEFFPDSTF